MNTALQIPPKIRTGSSRAHSIISIIGLTLLLAAFDPDLLAGDQPTQSPENQSPSPTALAEKTLRLGFSTHLFSGINEADARAAVRSLTATISRNKKIPANPDPFITQTIDQAEDALMSGAIDLLGMTTEEYRQLAGKIQFDRFLFTAVDGQSEEIFLLVVSKLGTARTLRDLSGRHLIIHAGPRTHLALPWLDLQLDEAGQKSTSYFFGNIEETTKATKAVLPVFFRKVDACLITKRSYLAVAEMNPQVSAELQIIAESPPYIPLIIAFTGRTPESIRDRVVDEFCQLHNSAYGQQGLMIFQTQCVIERPISVLATTLAMLDAHARRCPSASANRIAILHQPREQPKQQP